MKPRGQMIATWGDSMGDDSFRPNFDELWGARFCIKSEGGSVHTRKVGGEVEDIWTDFGGLEEEGTWGCSRSG
jgi:hypothetical protein